MDEDMVKWFKSSNNRVKSAVCRHILIELNITREQFNEFLTDWSERKVIMKTDLKSLQKEDYYDLEIDVDYYKEHRHLWAEKP